MSESGPNQLVQNPEPGSFRLIATMGVAGLAAGLLLVGIYLLTKPLIEANQWEALQRAILGDEEDAAHEGVLAGAESIDIWVLRDGKLAPYDGPAGQLPSEEAIYSGRDAAGGLIGFAVPAEGPGFQDTVGLIYGFDPVRQVIVGMAVLESRETPGLGDKIIFDENFHAGFEALAIEPPIVTVRDGRDAPNEVDVISGATISSDAVVKIINGSTTRWVPLLNELVTDDRSEGGD